MAVQFLCAKPQALLEAFKSRIAQSEPKGKITTWRPDSSGRFYTHTSSDQVGKAWFKSEIAEGRLMFYIINPRDESISKFSYAYYHGHLTLTFLHHFDDAFSEASSTALPEGSDKVAP